MGYYTVSEALTNTSKHADATRAFLAKLPAGEDVQLGGIEPTFSGEAALRGELKAEAMRQTRETAALLATSYGARVGALKLPLLGLVPISLS